MASSTNTSRSRLLLASLLCLVLLSQVGMLMAQVAGSPAPGPSTHDECPSKCEKRCSNNWKQKMCHRACIACCHRCPDHCVPDGPKASRDSCYCYSRIMTHGKYKCP